MWDQELQLKVLTLEALKRRFQHATVEHVLSTYYGPGFVPTNLTYINSFTLKTPDAGTMIIPILQVTKLRGIM